MSQWNPEKCIFKVYGWRRPGRSAKEQGIEMRIVFPYVLNNENEKQPGNN
jgi:hypothetical protein